MARFKRGDRVAIVEREVNAADRKSGLYYTHFQGLHGVVDQVYEEANEICVEVDQDSLPPAFLRRHQSIQDQARQKWLSGLSETERRGLSDEQRKVRFKYTVMVAADDLQPEGRGKAKKAADTPAPVQTPAPRSTPAQAAKASPATAPAPAKATTAAPKRPTEADLAAKEQEYLDALLRSAREKS